MKLKSFESRSPTGTNLNHLGTFGKTQTLASKYSTKRKSKQGNCTNRISSALLTLKWENFSISHQGCSTEYVDVQLHFKNGLYIFRVCLTMECCDVVATKQPFPGNNNHCMANYQPWQHHIVQQVSYIN